MLSLLSRIARTVNRNAAGTTFARRVLRTLPVPSDLGSITDIDHKGEVAATHAGLTDANVRAIWSAVEDLYCTGYYPAIMLCLRRRGHLVMNRAIGYANGFGETDGPTSPTLVTTRTPACLYSASKAVTAMLIHKLANDGVIDLLDPVAQYVPEFARHGKGQINIEQILAHRGGVPGIPLDEHYSTLGDHQHQLDLICNAKPLDSHQHISAYHALTGGTIVQAIVERVTGRSISAYWDEQFKQPMGFRYFDYGVNRRDFSRMAKDQFTGVRIPPPIRRYFKQYLGLDVERENGFFNDYGFYAKPIPAGNMVATAEETNRFFQMLLDGGRYGERQILTPRAVQRATREVAPHRFDRVLKLPLRCSAGMLLGGAPIGLYGPNTDEAFGHVGLINTFVWADPARDLSVSLLTTGKPLLAHNLPQLMNVLKQINQRIPGDAAARER